MKIVGYICVIWFLAGALITLAGKLPSVEHQQYPSDRPFIERAR